MVTLNITRLRVRWRFMEKIHLPAYPGSLVRGLIGHGLRRAACLFRNRECRGCPLEKDCVYARFFEAPARDEAVRRRFAHPPPPYVLEFDLPLAEQLPAGGELRFHLTLLDDDFLPYLVLAMEQAGRIGAGARKVPFQVLPVEREQPLGSDCWVPWRAGGTLPTHAIPSLPERLTLRLQTPLRLKRRGRLVRPHELDLATFIGAVESRLRDLEWLYGQGEPVERPRVQVELSPLAIDERRLAWKDWKRYSNRQGTSMKLGGIIGMWRLDASPLAPWWQLLWLGQWLHAGKQTSMGLGQYRLESCA